MCSLPFLYRCCVKCMYCKKQRQNFSGVWLIAVLLINPAIHASFSVLQCPGVEKEDGRWMNVHMCNYYTCFTSKNTLATDDEQLSVTSTIVATYSTSHTRTHTYTHKHACMHTHTHTHTHRCGGMMAQLNATLRDTYHLPFGLALS